MVEVHFTITPGQPTELELANAAYDAIEAAIRRDAEAMDLLRASTADHGERLIWWIAEGAFLWRWDKRFRQSKTERDASIERITQAAAELAAALRETAWPGLGLQEVKKPWKESPEALPDYLDWLAAFAREQQLDYPDHYPRGRSKTSERDFMLRRIKTAVWENGALVDLSHRPKLAAALARAVLDDPGIDEETIKKK